MELQIANEIKPTPFRLAYTAEMVQVVTHMTNLFLYFHEANEELRTPWDKKTVKSSADIIRMLTWLLENPYTTRNFSFHRYGDAVAFRCNQLCQYYGDDVMKEYLFKIFGKVL